MKKDIFINNLKKSSVILTAVLVISGFFVANFALAAATVSPASGGINISIDTTSAGGSGDYVELSGPAITEIAPGEISEGIHTISLPAGWEFDLSSDITVMKFGSNMTPSFQTVTPGTTSFSFTVMTASTDSGATLGFSGFKVRPTGTDLTDGNMTYSGAGITGVDGNTNFGTLSTTAGAVTQLAFTTQPTNTVYGSTISNIVVETQDQFGNHSTDELGENVDVLLTLDGPGILGGTVTLDIGTNEVEGVVSFTDLTVDSVGTDNILIASTDGFTSVDSEHFDITQKPINVTAQTDEKIYDGDNISDSVLIVDALAFSDTVETLPTQSFNNKDVGTEKTLNAEGLAITGGNDNYTINYVDDLTGVITAKNLTVTGAITDSKVYNGDEIATVDFTSAGLDGVVEGEELLVSLGSGGYSATFDNKNVSTGKTVNILGLALDGVDGSNYSLTQPVLNDGEITTRSLTVTVIGGDRVYDGTTDATVALSDDRVAGDVLITTYTTAEFNTKDVGTGKTVTVLGIDISGTDSSNYTLVNVTTETTADITEKELTVTGSTVTSKTYDGTTDAVISGATLSGIVSGDIVILVDDTSGTFDNKNVGVSKAVATAMAITGADAGNYTLTQPIITGAITTRAITVTAAANTKVYDDNVTATASPTITAGSLVSGDVSVYAETYDNQNVGDTKTLTPTVTSIVDGVSADMSGNYDVTLTAVNIGEITQATLTATITVSNKVWDGNNSATIITRTPTNVIGDDVVILSGGTATFVDADIGPGKAVSATGITFSGTDAANYSYDRTATGTGNILPIPTIVYVDDNWTGTEVWTDPDNTGPAIYFGYDAFASIQEAINAVADDGTINVAAGTYTESITVDKQLSIVGAGNTTTIIQPGIDTDGVVVTADGVVIKDLKVSTSNSGVTPNKAISVEEADNLEINNVVVETTGDTAMGIWIGGSNNGMEPVSGLTIVKSDITVNNEATGIYADHSTPAHSGWVIGGSAENANTVTVPLGNPIELYDVTDSEVSYNTITTSASGGSAVIWSSEWSDISNLTFSYNDVDYSGGSQVAFITDFPVTDTTDTTISTVTITENTFSNWGSRALRIGDGDGSELGTVTGVSITSNTFNVSSAAEVIGGTDAGTAIISYNILTVTEGNNIQNAIDVAGTGYNVINVAAGIYSEKLDLKGKSLDITGAGIDSTIINSSSLTGYAISNFGDLSAIRSLTLNGTMDNYGFKVSHVSDITLENIKVVNSHRTGVDLNTVSGAILNNIEVVGTSWGFGLMILDSNNVSVADITTANNAWGGVTVQAVNADANTITFSGAFEAGETFPLLLEKDPPYTGNFVDVSIPDKFDYITYAFREGVAYKQWFYFETLAEAKTVAQAFVGSESLVYSDVIIYDVVLEENYYVENGMKIQDAIDAASSDDTINVAAGTYTETVTLNKALTLQGPNEGISPNPPGLRAAEAVITGVSPLVRLPDGADVNPLTIEGFTFQNATVGVGHAGVIRADGGSEGWGNVTIRSNRFIDNYGPAIGVWATTESVNPANWTITDNLIDGVTGPSKSGIYLDLDTGLSGVAAVGFIGWEISDNTIRNIAYGGIMVDDAVDMVISGNTIEDVQKAGIQSSGVSEDLTIKDNVITRANSADANLRAGIRLYGVDEGDPYHAATLIGPVWVTNNIVTDSYIGFAIKDGHSIVGKVVHVNGNSFTGNLEAGLRHGGTGLLDATNNWWGSANGPTHTSNTGGTGDTVSDSDNVDFRPWYTNAELTGLDEARPSVTITSTFPSLTNVSPIPITVRFNEEVYNFEATDIVITNDTKGTFAASSGSTYTIDVTPTDQGKMDVDIAADVAWDLAGNYNTAAEQFSITYDSVAPTLTSVSIASNNANTALVKVDNTIILSFTSNETIQADPTVIFTSGGVAVTGAVTVANTGGNVWAATYIANVSDTDGAVAFTINFADIAGNDGSPVTDVTDASSVTFDKTAPVVAITAPAADSEVNGEAFIEFTDNEPTSPECSVGNDSWVSCESGVTSLSGVTGFGELGQGSFTLYLRDTDAAGNIGTDNVSLVKDSIIPTVVSHTPTVNAMNVQPDSDIIVIFSEAVIVEAGDVSFSPSIGGNFAVENSDTEIVTINPDSALDSNTSYMVTLSGVTDIAGNAMDSYNNINFTTATYYDISLYFTATGWNLISLPVVPNDTAIATVLGDSAASIETVWAYDPLNPNADQDTGWLSYVPDDPESTNNLDIMTTGYGYWISVKTDTNVSGWGSLLTAGPTTPPSRALSSGWNLVGYYQIPGEDSSIISKAFASLGGNYTGLWGYDNQGGVYELTVSTIFPGDAFWISLPSEKIYTPSNIE